MPNMFLTNKMATTISENKCKYPSAFQIARFEGFKVQRRAVLNKDIFKKAGIPFSPTVCRKNEFCKQRALKIKINLHLFYPFYFL
jgi:hypothetical protein